jgi:hypothetical protein
VQDDRPVADEVGDCDGVGDVVREGAVAAVGDGPDRAANGGGAVAAGRAELAVGARVQELEGLLETAAVVASPALLVLQVA